jgi:peptidoglycan/LPS O-acetylase OafA/YrhL
LSGFVVTSAYKQKVEHSLKFRDFLVLRLGRIYPMHLLMLALWVANIFGKSGFYNLGIDPVDPFKNNTIYTFFTNLFLVHSLNLHWHTSWNYPSWSISLEFFTYLLFFVFAYLIRGSKKTPWIALIISLTSFYYLTRFINNPSFDFTIQNGIFRCVGGFFGGISLYYLARNFSIKNNFLLSLLEVLSVFGVVLSVTYSSESKIILFSTLPMFAFAILIFSNRFDGFIGKVLQTEFLQNAGRISYSVYMIHALIFDLAFSFAKYLFIKPTEEIFFVQTELAFALNIVFVIAIYWLAKLSYFTVEKIWIDKSKKFVREINEFEDSNNNSILFS